MWTLIEQLFPCADHICWRLAGERKTLLSHFSGKLFNFNPKHNGAVGQRSIFAFFFPKKSGLFCFFFFSHCPHKGQQWIIQKMWWYYSLKEKQQWVTHQQKEGEPCWCTALDALASFGKGLIAKAVIQTAESDPSCLSNIIPVELGLLQQILVYQPFDWVGTELTSCRSTKM